MTSFFECVIITVLLESLQFVLRYFLDDRVQHWVVLLIINMSTGVSTRSKVLKSTGPGEKTLKPGSSPVNKPSTKGTEGEWSFIHAQLKEIKCNIKKHWKWMTLKSSLQMSLFLSLEKRNYVNKTVSNLVTDNGIIAS